MIQATETRGLRVSLYSERAQCRMTSKDNENRISISWRRQTCVSAEKYGAARSAIGNNRHMAKTSLGLMLAVACIAVEPSYAQTPGPAGTRFVVTAPVFGKLAPNTGIQSAAFTVRPFSGQGEVQVPFVVFSSNGALAVSFSACSGAKPSVQFGTPVNLVACIDTQKIVRGNYLFLLTVRYQKQFLGATEPIFVTAEPRAASPVDCMPPTTAALPVVHVA